MRCVLFVAVLAAGCEKVPAAKTGSEPEPKKEVKRGETGKKDSPRPPAGKKPAGKPAASFEDAWAEAVSLGRRLDAEEPAATAKSLAVLAAGESEDVREQMTDDLEEVAGSLTRAGFAAWVARESRKIAAADPAFGATARELWDGSGPRHVLGMMNSWGAVDRLVRADVAAHVARKTPTAELDPDVRDAVLKLGGDKWLRR